MGKRQEVSRAADTVGDHPILQAGARVGYTVSGVLHLLIGWIALQVALSGSNKSVDESGALQALAGNTVGRFTLWLGVVGFLALGLWELASAAAARPRPDSSPWAERAKGISKAAVHLVLAYTCYSTAQGRPSNNKAKSTDFTASLLQQTGGRVLVAGLGLAIVGVGVYHVFKGWKRTFLRDLDEHPGTIATRAGVAGYVAKGIALALVGILFIAAAMQNSSAKATGLDGALRALRQQAFGPWLLTGVALGIAAYGFYSFARARHARV